MTIRTGNSHLHQPTLYRKCSWAMRARWCSIWTPLMRPFPPQNCLSWVCNFSTKSHWQVQCDVITREAAHMHACSSPDIQLPIRLHVKAPGNAAESGSSAWKKPGSDCWLQPSPAPTTVVLFPSVSLSLLYLSNQNFKKLLTFPTA